MTDAKLQDEQHFSDDMLALGLDWYAENQQCDLITFEGFGRVSPELATLGVGWAQEIASIVNDAITNRPTYAALNRHLAALKEHERQDIRTWYAKTNARLAQQNAAEIQAQQEAFSSAAMQALQFALDVLVARQSALAAAQTNYVIVNPVYVPVRVIATTTCRYVDHNRRLVCN
jgi:hypothetical protein